MNRSIASTYFRISLTLVLCLSLPVVMTAQSVSTFNPDPGATSGAQGNGSTTSSSGSDTMTQANYNPDPGATLKPASTAFYEPPAGTPVEYGKERDPLQDVPRGTLADRRFMSTDWENQKYPLHPQLPAFTQTVQDRWRIDIPTWQRYNSPEQETPYDYQTPRLWDPYKQSILKGDVPIFGQDYFLSITGTSFTSYEARDIPTPAGVSTASANESEFYGHGNQMETDQFFMLKLDLFKGETSFKPVTWQVHLEPVYNINTLWVKENGVVDADPRGQSTNDPKGLLTGTNSNQSSGTASAGNNGGITNPGDPDAFISGNGGLQGVGSSQLTGRYVERTRDFFSLEEGYVEAHLADLSSNYDFVSLRVGNQPFNSDFRGFVFNDTNLGARIFGNMDSNRWQYNLVAFDMREKDTYSELNSFDDRHQYVFVANAYRQDFIVPGYTGQLSFLANYDEASQFYYDRDENLVRPEPLGTVAPHDVHSYYIGWNGDGHFGHLNITHSLYEVVGSDQFNGLAGQKTNINAQMAALELSYDFDWLRFKASFFYASGDNNATDNKATGFDSIVDNPNFIGAPFSYYSSQGFNLGGTSVNFKDQDSLLPDLRSSKFEGQSNFVNPGVMIYGAGIDADVMPNLKVSTNANYIRMVDVDPINVALQTNQTRPDIGWDLSIGATYRPFLTDNMIVSGGLGTLIPGSGYRSIYQASTVPVPGYSAQPSGNVDDFLYSAFASLTLTF